MTEQQTLSALRKYPEVMTVPEIAQILRIGRNKAYELISKGKIN